jgi:NAD(P)-dependent dehydrogenase (short-subunit alcohol dehydrogenase family)
MTTQTPPPPPPVTDLRIVPTLASQDLADLRAAAANLEGNSLAITLANKIGMPVEAMMRFLPDRAQASIATAVDRALEQCLRVALAFNHGPGGSRFSRRSHTFATAVTGAVGGFFGLAGLAVELPVTTTVMLHSIAGIAASQGEDLSQPESELACLEVLALGPDGHRGNAHESAYYATRAALAQVTREAAAYVAQKGLAKESAPALISFLSKIAGRFGLEVSEKAAAQLIPVVGAAGGLALNVLFTHHFQRLAQGHFTIRRLERKYGPELIRREYDLVRPPLKNK